MTTGRLCSICEREVSFEQRVLVAHRRERMEAVEPGLADRHHVRMLEEPGELVDTARLGTRGLVRVDPDRHRHTIVGIGDRERTHARLDARTDRHHARHPDRAGALEQRRGCVIAGVEVRVGIDHAGGGASIRGNNGAAGSTPDTASVSPYAT